MRSLIKSQLLKTACISALAAWVVPSSALAVTTITSDTTNTSTVSDDSGFDVVGTGITFTNNGTINFSVSGPFPGTFGINAASGNTIINTGSLNSGGVGPGISGGDNVTIQNSGSIFVGAGAAITVGNNSSITNTAGLLGFGGAIVAGDNTTIENSGLIHQGDVRGGIISFTNHGEIRFGTNGPLVTAKAGSTIINTGNIFNASSDSSIIKIRTVGTPSTTTITNSGTLDADSNNDNASITGPTIPAESSIDATELVAGEVVNITNSGTLDNVLTGAGNDSFTQTAGSVGMVNLGAGDNTLNFMGGSVMGSLIAGNGTNDLLHIGGAVNTFTMGSNVSGFENVTIDAGVFTLTNNTTISADSHTNPTVRVAAGSSITNSGSILNTNGDSIAVRINSTGGTSTTTIINTGTIKGASNGPTQTFVPGTGGNPGQILLGADTSIEASGLIATEAVNITNSGELSSFLMGAGNDSFNQTAGIASGDFGDGNHTITLSGGILDFLAGAGNNTLEVTGGELRGANLLGGGTNMVRFKAGTSTFGVASGSGTNDVFEFAGQGQSITFAGTINGFEHVYFKAGTTRLTNSNSSNFSDTATATIESGATLNIASNHIFMMTTNLVQQSGSTLRVAFDDALHASNNGAVIADSGNGTFANGSNIYVDVAPLNTTNFTLATIDGDAFTVFDGGAALDGTAIVNGAPTGITITSSNNLLRFTLSTADNGNDLVLTAHDFSNATSIAGSLLSTTRAGNINAETLASALGGGSNASNGSAAQQGFSSFLAGLSSSNTQQFNTVLNAFSNLGSTEQVADALEDLQIDSALTSGSTQALNASSSAQQGVVVGQLQQARTQLANAEYGASAGDDFGRDLRLWAQPFAAQFNQQAHDGFEGFDASSYGVLMGGDVAAHEAMRVGAALNYSTTNVTGDGNNAQNGSDIEGYGVMLYGTYTPRQNLFVDGMLGASFNRYEASRFVAFLGERAKADYNGHQLSGRLGVGYDIPQAGFIITPSSYLSTTRTQQDSFTETGSTVSLRVAEQTTTRSETGIGLKAAYPMKQRDGTFTPSLRVGASRAFGSQSQTSTQNFAAGGAAFTTRGAKSDRNALSSGIGLNYEALNGTVLTLDGNYEHRNTSDGISGFVRINAAF